MLCANPPDKLIATETDSYSLLLLHKGNDDPRVEETLAAIRQYASPELKEYPFIVGQHMTIEDALAGQFALACCDCITAFVRDEVICSSTTKVYRQLYNEVMRSSEFKTVTVEIEYVPLTDQGRRFCWQFFGLATGMPTTSVVGMFRKKARLITHWASKIGAVVTVIDDELAEPPADSR